MQARLRAVFVSASVPVVAITAVLWVSQVLAPVQDDGAVARAARRERLKIWNTPLDEGRCAISIAQFSGVRARLVRAEHQGTIHFAVIETPPRPTPLDVLRQGDWLKLIEVRRHTDDDARHVRLNRGGLVAGQPAVPTPPALPARSPGLRGASRTSKPSADVRPRIAAAIRSVGRDGAEMSPRNILSSAATAAQVFTRN